MRLSQDGKNKLATSANCGYCAGMSWQEYIRQFRVADVIEWTGVPIRTIYDWRNGRQPPPYVQDAMRLLIDAGAAELVG